MRVWLDDRRNPPSADWVWVKTPEEAIDLLQSGEVSEISLDHDLALWSPDGRERTGHDVALWIEEQVVVNGFDPPALIHAHSQNPPGRDRLQRAIDSIERRRREGGDR